MPPALWLCSFWARSPARCSSAGWPPSRRKRCRCPSRSRKPRFLILKVIFACVHNAGRSQMSAAFFNKYADPAKAHAISAGTRPADRVHPEVIQVMKEAGIDLSEARPQRLTPELAQDADLLITMGCGDECPFVPGLRRDDWLLPDPKGKGIERRREIRDRIREQVRALIEREGWTQRQGGRPMRRTRSE